MIAAVGDEQQGLARWCAGARAAMCALLVVLVLNTAAAIPAAGQAAAEALSGMVMTPTGTGVPQATVVARNTASGEVESVTSRDDGSYIIARLSPGIYQVTASAPGFVETTTTVTIRDGADETADLVLRTGEAGGTEELVATAAPGGGAAEEGLSAAAISDLPLQGRSSTDAASLEPGVLRARTQGRRGPYGFGSQMAIFGGRPRQNSSRLNGISVNDYANGPLGNAVGTSLGVDALEQLAVLTRNDQAEFGRSSGGYISSSTRAGGSDFHGSAFEYFRDDALDASDYFADEKPPLRRHQFGASAGGPLFRDQVFIFGVYEGVRETQGRTSVIVMPSEAARNGTLCSAPASGSSCTPTAIAVDPEVKRYLDAFYPVPSNDSLLGDGDTGRFVASGPQTRQGNHVTVRVDYKPSARDSLYGVYSIEAGSNPGADRFDEKLFSNQSRQQFATFGHTHTFGPRVLNTFRFGLYRMVADIGITLPGNNPLSGDTSFGFVPDLPHGQIRVPGLSNLGNGLNGADRMTFRWTSVQAYNDVSVIRGAHSFKFGVAFERMFNNTTAVLNPTGEFIFNSLADFLTNQPFSFTTALPGSDTERNFRQTVFGAYVQDDWLIRPNFSLSLGLRYEMATVPTEVNGKLAALRNLTDPLPWCQTFVAGCDPEQTGGSLFSNPTLRNFSPRVGFAWDPFRSGTLVISSGFGVFDVLPLLYQIQSAELFSAPFFVSGSATNLPAGSFPTGAYEIAAQSTTRSSQAYFEPNPKRNYVMQWNFTTQWRLPRDLNIKLGYVGSRGVHHVTRVRDANIVLPTLTPAGYLWPRKPTDPEAPPNPTLNPHVGSISAAFWNGDSYYNALVLQVRKRIGSSAQLAGSYTWGRSIDTSSASIDGDEYSNAISSPLWFDTRLNRGQSDFDISQSLKITYSWQLPSPRWSSAALAWPVSGWQIGGVYEASTGVPFTPGFGGDPLGVNSTDTNVNVPSVVAGPGCESLVNSGNYENYIRTECLILPQATPEIADLCTPAASDPGSCLNLRGNLRRNSLVGPGRSTLAFTVFKNNFIRSISDAFNIQFRAEIFNLFNRPNIQAPIENKNVFDSRGNRLSSAGLTESTQADNRNIQLAIKVIW